MEIKNETVRSTLVIWNLQTKFKGNVLEDINIYMSSVVFDMFLHINCHYIKNCIHYCAIQFMICSLYNNVQVIFEFKVFFFCFTVRVLECQLLWHWYDFFFSLSWNGIEEAWNSWSFYNFIKFLNVLKLFLLKGYKRCRSWTCSNKKTC